MITQGLFFALSLITRGVIGTTAVTYHQHHGQRPLGSLMITLQVPKDLDVPPLHYTLAPLPQTGNTSQEDTVQNSAQSHFHSNCPPMQELDIKGFMISVEASNVNSFTGPGSVAYLSCDIEPTSSSPSTLLNKVLDSEPNVIVLYTTSGDWCWLEGSSGVGNIFTTVNASDAQRSISYLEEAIKLSTSVQVSIAGNLGSLDQASEEEKGETGGGEKVLVVVSSIVGSVFGLFVLTTLVGVIRAYRHPERYGPRDEQDGHSSQTRIQGLTRAVLDTFPVVQFAHKGPSLAASTDHDVQPKEAHKNCTHGIAARPADPEPPACSICTENFAAQEDVRILPCKHEFHRSCIDPWLVKQSTKCPLCRCDFGPKDPSNRGQGNQSNREDELSERRETLMLRLLTVPG